MRPYDSPAWKDLRAAALKRDGRRCTVSRLLGGECSASLHVHHLVPLSEGGAALPPLDDVLTTCAAHHPSLEALRRYVLRHRHRARPRCPHRHPYPQGREECERRLAAA